MSARTVKRTNARNRRALDPSIPERVTPAVVENIEPQSADTIRITFSRQVMVTKLPGYHAGADGEATVTSAVLVNGTMVEFVFSADVAGTNLIIKGGDLGIRTPSGGFVPAGTYAIPTFP